MWKIPLLKEYILVCKKYGKTCVLEIKNHFEEEKIVKLIDHIKDLGYIKDVIFISFDFENCINVRKYLPENMVQFLTTEKVTVLPQAGGLLTLNLICPPDKKKVRGSRISGFPALCRDGAFRGCRRV